MHEGCNGSYESGKEVVDKLRAMGFSDQFMPMAFSIKCVECGETFEMSTYEDKCPHCKMVYGVTPCHAFDPENIAAAEKNY